MPINKTGIGVGDKIIRNKKKFVVISVKQKPASFKARPIVSAGGLGRLRTFKMKKRKS